MIFCWTLGEELARGQVIKTTDAISSHGLNTKKWVEIISKNTMHQMCLYHTDDIMSALPVKISPMPFQ